MTYNSEIIILNDTPERGTVTGKRMRLTGTQGKLYAKAVDKIYQFERWETPEGQVISTSNPLIIDDWQHQFIRVVFGHVLLSDQFFADRDAIETQTYMLETIGFETDRPYGTAIKYLSQKNIAGPATRTTSYGVTFPTGNKTYGYRSDDATWDPTGTPTHSTDNGTDTGTWYRSPKTHEFYPASGYPAEEFERGWHHKFKRRYMRRGYTNPSNRTTLYNWGLQDTTVAAHQWFYWSVGAYNNPTVGQSTMYPMLEWMPMTDLYKNSGIEPVDMTGLETSKLRNLYFTNAYTGRLMYNNVHNMDAASSLGIRGFYSDQGYGLVNGSYHSSWWSENPWGEKIPYTLHDTDGLKTSPRVLEPLAYTPLHVFTLKPQHHYSPTYPYSGPHDTTRDENTGKNKNNPHWVEKWQHVPHSGSLLWALRYTPVEQIRFGYSTSVSDFSSFGMYHKNMKHWSMEAPNYPGYGGRAFAGQSLPNMKGAKNLMAIAWYDNYNHTSFNIDEPFDWSGLKDATNLRSLYIYHSYDTYTKYINLSDIPSSVVDLQIYPTAYLSYEQFPDETTRFKLSLDNSQVSDKSSYKDGVEINITTLNIISTT